MHDVVVFELQFLACGVRRVDDEHVGPFDELLEHRLSARRFQIERDAALVAVGQMPGIGILRQRLRRDLMPVSPEIAARRLHLDHVGAEVGQDHGGAGTGDEAREVHHLQSGKNVVACHRCLSIMVVNDAPASAPVKRAPARSLCQTKAPRPVMALPTIRFCI